MAQKNQNESTTHLDIGPVLEALFDCSVVDSTPLQNANTKDNTFSFQGDRYETPVDLRGKEVQLRYERKLIQEAFSFSHTGRTKWI